MDPHKRATRPASDYMSRGVDPANVPVARSQKQAAQLYTQPGAAVPNNTMVGNQIQQELAQLDNARISSNPYQDWRAQNLPGTGVTYAMQRPAPGGARVMSPQAMPQSEQLGDLRWAGQVSGAGGPLAGPPNEWVQNPGLAKEAMRYGTGQPVGRPLPSGGPPPGREDLSSAQSLMPPAPDMMFASRVEGHPAEAALPSAGQGASPGAGGMPAVMPKPAGRS
jgi:hypothetical protein